MTKPNALERYTIHLVAEEASEAIQMTGKWGRFGPDHARRDGLTARAGLALELGDVLAAIDFALCAGLIDPKKMLDQREVKFARLCDPEAVDDEGRRLAPPLPSEAARLYITPAQPVADAGGVTEDDVIGLINIVTDLAEVDALDKAYPEVWGRLDAMVNHAVAAATAAKNARDPLRDIVFRYIDRMNDVAPECGDPADRILGEFARDVNAVLKAERAALSEAREAGDGR